jgi:3-hydroxyacyl-[acyl-carrier-protein] dehydratase
MRFDLVDNVLELSADRAVTVKNVTAAEEYLADHFPSFPVLPGVMMLESLVQAARRVLTHDGGPWVVSEVRNVRYGNMVRPGQQLRITVERIKTEGDHHTFQGRGEVDGSAAVQGRFTLRPVMAPPSRSPN